MARARCVLDTKRVKLKKKAVKVVVLAEWRLVVSPSLVSQTRVGRKKRKGMEGRETKQIREREEKIEKTTKWMFVCSVKIGE